MQRTQLSLGFARRGSGLRRNLRVSGGVDCGQGVLLAGEGIHELLDAWGGHQSLLTPWRFFALGPYSSFESQDAADAKVFVMNRGPDSLLETLSPCRVSLPVGLHPLADGVFPAETFVFVVGAGE